VKKPPVVVKVMRSINHQVVHHETRTTRDGKTVDRTWRSWSLNDLMDRAEQLFVQCMPSADRDGFSTTTPGNGSPGAGKGASIGSSVESAVVDFNRRHERDQLSEHGADAWAIVQRIAADVAALDVVLGKVELLQNRVLVPDAHICAVAAGYGLPWDDEWSVRDGRDARLTDFAGVLGDDKLEVRQLVCRYVYKFVHKHKRLPTSDEMLAHIESKVDR
jgi:hypothetical protein